MCNYECYVDVEVIKYYFSYKARGPISALNKYFPEELHHAFYRNHPFSQSSHSTQSDCYKPRKEIMASRSFSRVFRSSVTRQLVPVTQQRTLVLASKYARTVLAATEKLPVTVSSQQSRGIKTIDFAGTKETVYGMTGHQCWLSWG